MDEILEKYKGKSFNIEFPDDKIEDIFIEIAELFSWVDNPMFGGSPTDRHWHAAKMLSACRRMWDDQIEIIDAVYGLNSHYLQILQTHLNYKVHEYQRKKNPSWKRPAPNNSEDDEIEVPTASPPELVQTALDAKDRLVEYAAKIGFLYRDAWWLENHGDAALKGYLAKATATKAGLGGTKASSSARKKRIDLFLVAHAELVQKNPNLRDDPEADLALRALRYATKNNPKEFKRSSSRKTALEYWEYIKADKQLWSSYSKKLLSNNVLK